MSEARRRRRMVQLLTVGALALLTAGPSMAAEAEEQAEEPRPYDDSPCAADSARLCSEVPVGTRTIFDCLSRNRKLGQVREECAAFVDGVKAERQAAAKAKYDAYRAACANDKKKFCDEFDKQLAINGCLNRRRAELSEQCNKLLPRRGGYRGPGNIRFKDGSEPEDYDLKQAMRSRPLRTRKMLEAQGKPVPEVEPRPGRPRPPAKPEAKPAPEIDPETLEWMKQQIDEAQKRVEARKAAEAQGSETQSGEAGESATAAP